MHKRVKTFATILLAVGRGQQRETDAVETEVFVPGKSLNIKECS